VPRSLETASRDVSDPSEAERASTAYRRYFREFLPSILGQRLIEDLRGLDACVEIRVRDQGDPPWRLAIASGRLVSVGPDGPEPVCRFSLDVATMLEVVSARCLPAQAFFDKRIDIEGDMETGLMLSTVLEPFFRRFPFDA
jgi:predicted lipid carrier protein YhbT